MPDLNPPRLSAAVAAVAAILMWTQAWSLPPVWTVHGSRGEIVLFGSVHMLPDGLDWKPAALQRALAQADTLWFEVTLGDATDQAVMRASLSRGRLGPGRTLWDLLTPRQRADVDDAAKSLELPAADLAHMQPWMADLTLSLAADARAGARTALGVEAQVQNAAPATARRMALETVDQQIAILTGGGAAEQAASLDQTSLEITKDPDIYTRMVREWTTGDVAALHHEVADSLLAVAPGAYARMISNRNQRWARTLTRLARKPGRNVVIVGIGHLVGPDGVPALLRAQGLTVEGP